MTARIVIALLGISTLWACGSDSVTAPEPPAHERGLHEVGAMTRPRFEHAATLLQSGKVLIAGGNAEMPPIEPGVRFRPNGLVSAEIFDPETGVSTPTGDLTASRWDDHGILLPEGRVLMISRFLRFPIEIYDPHSGRFDFVANAPWPNGTSTATLLPNGEVLLIGGSSAGRARVLDPASGTLSDTFAMDHPGYGHTATLLKDGRVLIVGGHVGDGPRVQTAEIYDPETDTFSPAGTSAMHPLAALLLPSGRAFFIHSDNGNISLYNPDTQVFSPPTGYSLGPWRNGATVTLLDDGRVLIAGGIKTAADSHSPESISDQILIFTP